MSDNYPGYAWSGKTFYIGTGAKEFFPRASTSNSHGMVTVLVVARLRCGNPNTYLMERKRKRLSNVANAEKVTVSEPIWHF